MNKKISYMLSMLLAGALFTSCKNGDALYTSRISILSAPSCWVMTSMT